MNSTTDFEVKGNLRDRRLAELLTEVARARLNGSLRASRAAQKSVVYFDAGAPVFAVSNERRFRLFEFLLRENKISKTQLAALPDFTNDLALKAHLLQTGALSKIEADALFSVQIAEILKDAFAWSDGEWIFSPLVRIKGDIKFNVDAASLLLDYARNLPNADVPRAFAGSDETFAAATRLPDGLNLRPEEAFVFSRFENAALTLDEIGLTSGLPDAATRQIIYALWLGGFLTRQNWRSAFSERQISYILSANLSLKKDEKAPVTEVAAPKVQAAPPVRKIEKPAIVVETAPMPQITLEEYLERTEKSENYYRFFDVAPDAPAADIKNSYFTLARNFHPDLFHRKVEAAKHQRIQNAFTKIAHAYETLKNEKTRTVYDYKMRKELAEMEKSAASGASALEKHLEAAKIEFERGFELLANENPSDAIPFLARAVHFAGDNARYRAFYGKALAADDRQKHRAEAELQAAVKLDPNNSALRLMLAEFFVRMRLPKRAEGELNRLLTISPGNADARALLDSLPKR